MFWVCSDPQPRAWWMTHHVTDRTADSEKCSFEYYQAWERGAEENENREIII